MSSRVRVSSVANRSSQVCPRSTSFRPTAPRALAFAGSTALALSAVASRLHVIRSVKTLPTLKAEAITPYSADVEEEGEAAQS